MEEETNVNKYIVTQKLPKETSSKKKVVESLTRVTNLPALGQNDITEVRVKYVMLECCWEKNFQCTSMTPRSSHLYCMSH